jgi:hypothetical protein
VAVVQHDGGGLLAPEVAGCAGLDGDAYGAGCDAGFYLGFAFKTRDADRLAFYGKITLRTLRIELVNYVGS